MAILRNTTDKGFKIPHLDLVEVEDEGHGPRHHHQATPPDPGGSGESQPPSTDSSISVKELAIDTPKQRDAPPHRTIISQGLDDADSPAGTQAKRFQQDLAHSETGFQDFGEVRVQDFREVRIQCRNLAGEDVILRVDRRARQKRMGQAWPRMA